MTPPRIAVLCALSPDNSLSVDEIATAAFPGSPPEKARQRVRRALHCSGVTWRDGNRVLSALDGLAISPINLWPRRWLLSSEGIRVRDDGFAAPQKDPTTQP